MSEEQIKQDVVNEEVTDPTEGTTEQTETQNAEEAVVDAGQVLDELKLTLIIAINACKRF